MIVTEEGSLRSCSKDVAGSISESMCLVLEQLTDGSLCLKAALNARQWITLCHIVSWNRIPSETSSNLESEHCVALCRQCLTLTALVNSVNHTCCCCAGYTCRAVDRHIVAGLSGQQDCRVGATRAIRRHRQTVCSTFMLSQSLVFIHISEEKLSLLSCRSTAWKQLRSWVNLEINWVWDYSPKCAQFLSGR